MKYHLLLIIGCKDWHVFSRLKACMIALCIMMSGFHSYAQQEDSVRSDSSFIEPVEETEEIKMEEGERETSQPEVMENDTTEIGLRNRKVTITKDDGETKITIGRYERKENERYYQSSKSRRNRRYYHDSEVDFLSFDLGVTNFHDGGTFGREATVDDLELRAFRPLGHWALHFFPTRASLVGRGVVNLETAISLDFNNYYFVRDITLLQDLEMIEIIRTGDEFERNKLSALYAQIPLMINFRTDGRNYKGVSLSVGGYFGLLWRSRTIQKIENDKIKVKDRFNLNNQKFGVTARLSFKWFRVYFNYNISPLFEDGEGPGIGPEVSTFSTGINVVQF